MKIDATVILTEEEMLDILTRSINEEFRYTTRIPIGEAVELVGGPDNTYKVIWGQRPVPVELTPENSDAVEIECKPSCCSSDAS